MTVLSFYVLTEPGYVFKYYIEKERKCSFENAVIEKNESSTNLK